MNDQHRQLPRPSTGKALFVAYLLPLSEEGAAAGVYRRQRLMVEAIKAVCAEIEVLFYVPPLGPLAA